jgi:hypothetical protein
MGDADPKEFSHENPPRQLSGEVGTEAASMDGKMLHTSLFTWVVCMSEASTTHNLGWHHGEAIARLHILLVPCQISFLIADHVFPSPFDDSGIPMTFVMLRLDEISLPRYPLRPYTL